MSKLHCVGRGVEVIAQPFLPFLTGMLEKTYHQKKFYTGGPTPSLIIFHLEKTKFPARRRLHQFEAMMGSKKF